MKAHRRVWRRHVRDGIVRDNIERKQAEQALRESEERFRNLVEGSIQGIFIHREFKPLFVNPAFVKILGYDSAEELLATLDSIEAHHAPYERARLRGYKEARLTGEAAPVEYEYDALRKDGSILTLQNVVRLIRWQGEPAIQSTVVDITERKRAEEALRESEKRYRVLYEDNPAMYFTVDREGTVLSVNRFGAEQLGYTVDELLGQSVLNIFHPDDKDAVLRGLNGCFENPQKLSRWEFRKVHKDGGVIWVREAARAVRATDRKTLALIVCNNITELKRAEESLRQAHDALEQRVVDRTKLLSETVETLEHEIAQRRRTEKALRESEERYRTLVEYSPAAIVVHDLGTGRYVDCNQSAIDFFGLARDRLLQVGPEAVSPRLQPDGTPSEEKVRAAIASGLEGDRLEYEYTFLDAAGQEITCEVRVVRLPAKDRILLRTSIINISERKRAEEALEKQRTFLRQVIDIDPNFIFAKDREGRFTLVNQAVAEAYGATVDQLIGKTDADFNPNVQEVEFFRRMDLQVMDALQERIIPEERITDARGNLRWMQTVKRPIIGEDGIANQVLGSATDITKRKEAEEALRELSGRLISAQEEERRRVARELHDDLTQRLAVVAIEAGKLEQQLQGGSEPVLERLRRVKEQMIELSAVVHGISRQLHPSILDDLGLVNAIEAECMNFSQREGIQVTFRAKNVPAALPRDIALCLYRILQEGLRNIAKHASTKKADVALTAQDGSIVLSVGDQGIGFDPAGVRGKRGLGLASMQERLRLIRGHLSIRSEPGKSTIIEVWAPVAGGDG